MRILVQRVKEAKVEVKDQIVGNINYGMLLLVGFTINDKEENIDYLVDKVINLRIFDDESGVMNKSLLDINGEILSISQFTLYADARKGRRPSYDLALKSEESKLLYELFNKKLKDKHIKLATGIFQAEMQVSLVNDGPVTILLESRIK
jgi:D-aminoacyl-tRNA deacylase